MTPTGQRRARLSDEQTARRVLDVAVAQLVADGVSVGLDRLRFEDAIRVADVARASAYRRWPTRDAFVEDVVVELARGSEVPGLAGSLDEGLAALVDGSDDLRTAAGRHDLAVELLRYSFQADLEATTASAQFRSYLALRATFVGLRSATLRARVAAELGVGERRAVARGAAILAGGAALLGRRLTAPLTGPDGFETLARGIVATSVGFVVSALADPSLLTTTREVAAYGSRRVAAWSVPAYTLAGLVLAHTEADPDARPPARDELAAGVAGLVRLGAAAAARVPGAGVSGS